MIEIKLTDEQVKKLKPISQQACSAAQYDEKGMILAQVYPDKGSMKVEFIENKRAKILQKVSRGEL